MYTVKEAKYSQWDNLLKQCNRANLLQMWEYGEAKRVVEHWEPHRYVISDNGQPLGIIQTLTKSLPLIGRIVRINRGPLFFSKVHIAEDLKEIIKETMCTIFQSIVKGKKCYLRIVPEINSKQDFSTTLGSIGFHQLGTTAWSSAVIDLSLSEDTLFKNLHGKWRNLLRKSKKMGLELEERPSDETMAFLMEQYCILQKDKGFTGTSVNTLMELGRQISSDKQMQILFARKNKQRIAGILIVGHGNSCTYLVGWNSREGRDLQANYFLLWQAVINFKNWGYRWFDLGGINENKTPGIAHFKRGLRGKEYTLNGEFEAFGRGVFPFMVGNLSHFL